MQPERGGRGGGVDGHRSYTIKLRVFGYVGTTGKRERAVVWEGMYIPVLVQREK